MVRAMPNAQVSTDRCKGQLQGWVLLCLEIREGPVIAERCQASRAPFPEHDQASLATVDGVGPLQRVREAMVSCMRHECWVMTAGMMTAAKAGLHR